MSYKIRKISVFLHCEKPTSVAQLYVRGDGGDQRLREQHSVLEIDHEIFSTVILCLPLLQEGQFLAKECAQYWLTA